jgi:Helix-turn-helix domain
LKREVEFTPSTRVLRGLDEIAAYLKVSRRTAQRWVNSGWLLAFKGPFNAYMTTTSLLDLWIISAWECERKARNGEGSVNVEDEGSE